MLGSAGVTVETVDTDHVRLRTERGAWALLLRRLEHRISPSRVPIPPNRPALLALPTATPATVETAARHGWNLVTDDGTLRLKLGRRDLRRDKPVKHHPAPRRPGPTPWATFTLARRLLAGPPATQVELAEGTGVSQSKISRAVSRLSREGLVRNASPVGSQRTSTGFRTGG